MFTNTLSSDAKTALALLGKSKILKDAYLAGGSALALHFGHRLSVDFDFFTLKSFSQEEVALKLGKLGDFKVKSRAKDTLLGKFNGIDFSLFRYRYPLLSITTKFSGIELARPKDIAAMKIAAVMDRGTKKDFIDLYFLSTKGITLEKCLKYYDKKYGVLASNLYSIITSLSYFTDAEVSKEPVVLSKITWEEVKRFFEKESVRLADKFLK